VRHGERGNFVPGLTKVAVSSLDEVFSSLLWVRYFVPQNVCLLQMTLLQFLLLLLSFLFVVAIGVELDAKRESFSPASAATNPREMCLVRS